MRYMAQQLIGDRNISALFLTTCQMGNRTPFSVLKVWRGVLVAVTVLTVVISGMETSGAM